MATFTDISDSALARVDDIAALADNWATQTLARMDTLADEADALLLSIEALTYVPVFDPSMDLDYVEYTAPVEQDLTSEAPTDPALNTLDTVTDFAYSETPYTELVKTQIQTAITNVLGGTVIVGTAIWDAIWDRVVDNFGQQQVGEEWQASDAGASKGWELPSETTLARLTKAEDETSKRTSAAALENAIQQAVQYREDQWNAVTNGTQFEKTHMDHHNNVWNRALDAAKATVSEAIRINEMLLKQDDLNVRVYLAKWDGIARRVGAESDKLRARTGVSQLEISSEQSRLGYERSYLEQGFKTKDGETGLALDRARISVDNIIGTLGSLANIASGMTQAALTASDVNVGTSANISENHNYNYAL